MPSVVVLAIVYSDSPLVVALTKVTAPASITSHSISAIPAYADDALEEAHNNLNKMIDLF